MGDFNANNEINTRDLLNSSEEMGDVSIEDSQEGSLGSASLLLPSWLEVNKSSTNVNLGPIEAFLEALVRPHLLFPHFLDYCLISSGNRLSSHSLWQTSLFEPIQ